MEKHQRIGTKLIESGDTGNRMVKILFKLAFIIQGIENRSWEVMLQLYTSTVNTTFAVLFFLPSYRKDVIKMEMVQKKACECFWDRRNPTVPDDCPSSHPACCKDYP